MMTGREYRARENRLYVRILLADKQPDLAAQLSDAADILCPVCGGILVTVPPVDREAQVREEIPACGICHARHYPWRQCPLVTA